MIDLGATFYSFDNEYNKFDCVSSKRSSKRDIHALLTLESHGLIDSQTAVGNSQDYYVYINVPCDQLEAKTDEDLILELVRCGVRYDELEHALYFIRT